MFAYTEVAPRNRKFEPVPAVPEPGMIVSPGVLACRTSVTFRAGAFCRIWLAFTDETALPMAFRRVSPAVPVMTISSSAIAVSIMRSSTEAGAPTPTVTDAEAGW